MKHSTLLLSLLIGSVSAPVLADIQATYRSSGAQVEIVVSNNQHIRMNMSQGQFLLKQGDDIYSVSGSDAQGYTAISLNSIAAVSFGSQDNTSTGEDPEFSLVNTGKTETVAGFEGNVFVLTYRQDGKKMRSELVLSKDPQLAQVRSALMSMTSTWAKMAGANMSAADSFAQTSSELNQYGGLLRQDNSMVLLSLSQQDMPDDYYALPPNTRIQDLSIASAMMDCNAEGAEYNPLCLMQDAGEEAVEETKQEARQQAKDKVKDKIKGFLKDIF